MVAAVGAGALCGALRFGAHVDAVSDWWYAWRSSQSAGAPFPTPDTAVTEQADRLNMALAGRYRIERELGQGGMATVYLAEDLKHDRKVAIKVLKPELAAVLGAERFVVEIKTTAAMSHPHILPLFDSGTADGFLFYVMPYIEGETIRDKLNRETQFGVEDAVRIAREVADALDYAHRHGVIHRDIKPENLLLHDGRAMVMDFGIALAVSAAAGGRMTETGLSLGTPHYMSPEQATAEREITARSDVYSLGSVLHEMLTGNPPFTGAVVQQIIMKIITEPAELVTKYRKAVPQHVAAAVAKALEKLPADRFESAKAFADALANTGFTNSGFTNAAVAAGDRRAARANVLRSAPFLVVASVALMATIVALWGWRRPTPPVLRARLLFALGDSTPLIIQFGTSQPLTFALSPDDSQFAWVSTGTSTTPRIYLRALDGLAPQPLSGTENATHLQFSPDGRWLAFTVGSRLKKVSLSGGPAVDVADDVVEFSWGDADVLLLVRASRSNGRALWRMSAAGGTPEPIATPTVAAGSLHWPHLLPGAQAALFAIRTVLGAGADSLAVVTLADGHVTRLGIVGTNPRYVAPGYVIFGRTDGTVTAASFDAKTLRVGQLLVPVLANVPVSTSNGATAITVGNGTLVYAQGWDDGQLVTADREGRVTPMAPGTRRYTGLRYAPDGKRLALAIFESTNNTASDIWIRSIAEGTLTQFTNDGRSDRPAWTTDGRRLGWVSQSDSATRHVKWGPADGSGVGEVLIANAWSVAFAPSDQHAYVTVNGPIDDVALDSTHRRTPWTPEGFSMKVSPDGAWVAFVARYSGREEVYVRAAAGETGLHQISTDGGIEPVWAPNGRELYYRGNEKFLAAQIATQPVFSVVRRDTLFTDVFVRGHSTASYDISPDGKTFVLVRPVAQAQHPIIVFGWLDDLRERMKPSIKP